MKQIPLIQFRSALRLRAHPKAHEPHAADLRRRGVPETDIAQSIEHDLHVFAALSEGRCPSCGSQATAYADPRRTGHSNVSGRWIMFRCSTQPPPGNLNESPCRFMMDIKL